MVTFELDKAATLTDREKKLLAEARRMPIIYDEDSPELTDNMEKAFSGTTSWVSLLKW